MKDLIEIVNYLEDSGLLSKGVCKTIQHEAKEQKGGFLSMLFSTLDASLLRNILARKGMNGVGEGAIAKSVSEETKLKRQCRAIARAGYGNKKSSKYKIQKYYQNQTRFNGVYSRDNLPKIKGGAYVINLDNYSDIGTHSIALYVQKMMLFILIIF